MKIFGRYKTGWVPEGPGWRKEGFIVMGPRKSFDETSWQLRKIKSPKGIQLSVWLGSFKTLRKAMKAGNKAIKKNT
jgi:hypothetical protein